MEEFPDDDEQQNESHPARDKPTIGEEQKEHKEPTRCATRSTCGQALDFWNQNDQKEYILPCRYSRLKDETSEKSGVICGRDSRPPHPCGVRSVTSRRTRSSNCWQDLGVSTCARAAWIAVNRSCRKSERSSQFPLAPKRCVIVLPYPTVRPRWVAKA